MEKLIELLHVNKSYKSLCVFDDLSLTLDSNTHLISLIGPDGSGKSTLLKIIAGLERVNSGSVKVIDREVNRKSSEFVSSVGFMSQELYLYKELSVYENLVLFAKLKDFKITATSKSENKEKSKHSLLSSLSSLFHVKDSVDKETNKYFCDLLRKVGLYDFRDYSIDSLSGGMKQKIALACCIVAKPKLIILDEPTVGVDPLSRTEIWEIIQNYVDEGGYCIFSSLYLEESDRCDFSILINNGKIVAQDRADRLKTLATDYCYSLTIPHIPYLYACRYLMHYSKDNKKNSPIIDVCPRNGEIYLLCDRKTSQDKIKTYIKDALTIELDTANKISFANNILDSNNDNNSNDSASFAKSIRSSDSLGAYSLGSLLDVIMLKRRKPILEDAYLLLTLGYVTEADRKDATKVQANSALINDIYADLQGLNVSNVSKQRTLCFEQKTEGSKKALKDKTFANNSLVSKNSLTNHGRNDRENVIEATDLKKVFGSFVAVANTSFKVKKGEIFGLLGPNGAGKTTTFRMICALLNPSSGTVLVDGVNLFKAKSSIRSQIGYVAQKFSLYGNLTLSENLEYFAKSYGLTGKALEGRIANLVAEFSLGPFLETKAKALPFGIQRQLAMACALVHKPKILFLDEATSGADPKARRTFWSLITKLQKTGTSIVVTTHFMEEAEYCDRFLIQDKGKILFLGSGDEICTKDNGTRRSVESAFIDIVKSGRQDHEQC